jgi:hypothetical protein
MDTAHLLPSDIAKLHKRDLAVKLGFCGAPSWHPSGMREIERFIHCSVGLRPSHFVRKDSPRRRKDAKEKAQVFFLSPSTTDSRGSRRMGKVMEHPAGIPPGCVNLSGGGPVVSLRSTNRLMAFIPPGCGEYQARHSSGMGIPRRRSFRSPWTHAHLLPSDHEIFSTQAQLAA